MNWALVLQNLATPPILFFMLGMAATLMRSDLAVPKEVARFLSLYLLFAIGFHGGVELRANGVSVHAAVVLLAAVVAASVVPLWSFFVLRLRLDVANAAAIAATYGSISAVTFVTAVGFLETQRIAFSGYMVAAMALMESPAIVVGVLLARRYAEAPASNGRVPWRELGREAFFNGAVFVLMGSLLVGVLTGQTGWESVEAFAYAPFKGVLCLFLLDMGLVAAQRLRDLTRSGPFLLGFALVAPPVHAMLGIVAAAALGLQRGDALLFAVLCGSASYIAVPAAVRLSIPQANPSLYVPMSLAVTFPLNIAVGIPLYLAVIDAFW